MAAPKNMKAVEWTTPSRGLENDLKVVDNAPQPEKDGLPPGWTLVKVAYSTLNQGQSCRSRFSHVVLALTLHLKVDFKVPELPIGGFLPTKTPCMDFSGVAVRPNRSDMQPGQRVFGKTEPPKFGALAEYLLVANQGCVAVPESLGLEDAATIGVTGLTAYQCIVPLLKPGGKILINGGSGGVGVFAIQIAKIHGLHVTVTCSGANAELCKSLGADEVIDYRAVDLVKHLSRTGRQYDALLDLVFFNADLYWQCQNYLKSDAPYITIVGIPSLTWVRTMLAINLWPSWFGGGQRRFRFVMCKATPKHYAQIAEWMAEGKIKAVVEQRLEMGQIREGFARLKTFRTKGKLTVKIGGDDVAL